MPRTISQNPTQDPVLSETLTSPPGSETVGDRYIIAGTGGAWSGYTIGDIVEVVDTDPTVWRRFTPQEGWDVWIHSIQKQKYWDGSAWVVRGSGASKLEDLEDVGNASPTEESILISDGTHFNAVKTEISAIGLLRSFLVDTGKNITIPANEVRGVVSVQVLGNLYLNGVLKVM